MSGMRATTPMKAQLARQIRTTAGKVDDSHPEMAAAGQHLRNAATLVQSGQHDGAKRHLDAAMELMTPRNLIRHGITDDEGHATGKMAMHQMNVHRLGVMDIQDTEARNNQQASAKKDSLAEQAQQRAAKLQQAAAAKAQAATAQAAAKQTAIEQKTAAKPTGTGPGSQQQTGAAPDPILATATPTRGGMLLSAQTAALEVTPHPNGRPGGPGLYGKAGNKHSDYFEQIVHALMTKRGMSQAQASAIAWSRLRKWSAGGGNVHPEVRAAAAGALAREQAAKLSWDTADQLIELACAVELAGFNPAQQRVPAGQAGGGQFGGQGQGQPGGKGTRAQRRTRLVKQAVTLRSEISALLAQIHSATHHGKSKSSTPAKKGAAATSAKQAAASKAKSSTAKASAKHPAKTQTLAQLRTRLSALRAELHTTMQAIHQLADEDRPAIELAASAAYRNAWRTELRGKGGQFAASPGGPRPQSSFGGGKAARAQWRAAHGDRLSPSIHKLDALNLPSQVSPEPGEDVKQAATRRALLAFTQKQLQDAINTPVQQMDDHQLEVSTRVITSLTDHKVDMLNQQLAKVVTAPVADHVKRHLEGLRQELNRETAEDGKKALIFHIAAILAAVGISLLAGGLGLPAGIAAIVAVSPAIAQEFRDWKASQQTIGDKEKVSGREIEKDLSWPLDLWQWELGQPELV